MTIDLDTKYGPFPLKVWLIIGAGGVGIGLFASSKMKQNDTASTGALAVPPQVIFNRVTIGIEHVPDTLKPLVALKPPAANPILPSNPAATVVTPPVQAPIHITQPSTDFTAVAPHVWADFINPGSVPGYTRPVAIPYVTDPSPPRINLNPDPVYF